MSNFKGRWDGMGHNLPTYKVIVIQSYPITQIILNREYGVSYKLWRMNDKGSYIDIVTFHQLNVVGYRLLIKVGGL